MCGLSKLFCYCLNFFIFLCFVLYSLMCDVVVFYFVFVSSASASDRNAFGGCKLFDFIFFINVFCDVLKYVFSVNFCLFGFFFFWL